MTAEAKDLGRAAFAAQEWEDAVRHFTTAIESQASPDVSCLAIRSSAYQKLGNLEAALQDADATVQHDPTYVRGYLRKACVLRMQQEYDAEVETYLKGLEHVPGDESLTQGLSMARRLLQSKSRIAQQEAAAAGATDATSEEATPASTARRMGSTSQATRVRALVAPKTTSPTDPSLASPSALAYTKMELELKLLALQAQMDLIQELERLPTPSDRLDWLWELLQMEDTVSDATVADLAKRMQPALTSKALQSAVADNVVQDALTRDTLQSFFESVLAALKKTDEDSGTKEFASLTLMKLVENVFCQVLLAGLWTSASAADKAEQMINEIPEKSILNDERMKALFVLFDKDSDATVDFKEVAIGLYPLTTDLGEATKNAARLLLMMDKNDERVLTYQEFAKLILAVAAAFGMTFDQLAKQLLENPQNGADGPSEEAIMQELLVAEEAYAKAAEQRREESERQKTWDALSYSRTQRLFELWDTNSDGTIDFQELLSGLRRYQKATLKTGVSASEAERDALMIMGYDKDRNQALDPEEFAHAMANYAEAIGRSLHELIDFMCVVSSQSSTAKEYEIQFEDAITVPKAVVSHGAHRFKPSMGTILDTPEADVAEEGEEEEEGW
eukprot:Nitzschia sp. Nitz4//scaffold26_size159584//151672//153612//NITZ4_002521-RA/size159584-snap-gene-0.50-mRNA-1//-1//CDS//3329545172//7456//frame0